MGDINIIELTEEQKNLLLEDFETVPVDVYTFITNTYYLGNSWMSNGKLKAFPKWVEAAQEVYPLPMRSPYSSVLLLGATGIGKTSFAVNILMAYYLYLVLLLRDPHAYFDLAPQKKIVFAFLNIVTKTIAYKNAWGMFHTALLQSPFFMERGNRTQGKKPEWYCTTKPVELLYGNDSSQIIGLDLLAVFMDEVSFARVGDIKKAQEKAAVVFNSAIERMTSRFTKFGGIFEGLMIMASSKRTDQAFAEVFAKKLKEGSAGNRVYIVDKPRWEILPKDTYSGETFAVAIGDKYRASQIIQDSSDEQRFRDEGYKIIYPPIETKAEFERDLQNALTNIAGVSVQNSVTFLRGDRIKETIDKTILNPFTVNPISVGQTSQEEYYDYFDMSRIREGDKRKPLYIHLDASLTEDGTAIAGVVQDGVYEETDSSTGIRRVELKLRHLFQVKIKAPKGDRIMLRKNTTFILWLKEQGFNIAQVSSDQFQSEQFGQDIQAKGITYKRQSIDRVTDGINQPYFTLQNIIYDKRITLINDEDLITELVYLEKDANGRVDKPEGGTDDASQALCGAVYGAMQDKEAYMGSSYLEMFMATSSSSMGTAEQLVPSTNGFDISNLLADMNRQFLGAAKQDLAPPTATEEVGIYIF